MELNNFVFPRPQMYWDWEAHLGELVFIPVKSKVVSEAAFYGKLEEKPLKVRSAD